MTGMFFAGGVVHRDALSAWTFEDIGKELSQIGRMLYTHPPALDYVLGARPLATSRDQSGIPSGPP
jgi:hypothetical protein